MKSCFDEWFPGTPPFNTLKVKNILLLLSFIDNFTYNGQTGAYPQAIDESRCF